MRQTTKKLNERWVILFLAIAVSWHLITYLTYEPKAGAEIKSPISERLFFISLYNVGYFMSIALSFLATSKGMKVFAGILIAATGYLIFLEFASNPKLWTWVDRICGLFSIGQAYVIIKIVDVIKSRSKNVNANGNDTIIS